MKQLIINNYKFLHLIYIQDKLNLTLVDCDFKNIDTDDLLEGEKFNSDSIIKLIEDQEYRIMKLYFRTKNHHMVTLKSNGVLGIDSGLSEEERIDIKKLIDFISFGPVLPV
ncbi:TetR family transcriptional regulator [Paucisalibacillus globulus]|uniref:TetR family transcriptional regulator n=1 Tax=Paucisalibacillus globulus TaxID=351095 RepID=UPI000BB8605E|nr:TetR family transcriptional regulator [Paucisalibacillus globulus]